MKNQNLKLFDIKMEFFKHKIFIYAKVIPQIISISLKSLSDNDYYLIGIDYQNILNTALDKEK